MNKLLSLLPFPIPSLATAQCALVAFAFGVTIGGISAWHIQSKFSEADKVEQTLKTVAKAQASVETSNSIEASDIKTKAEIQIRYKVITKEIEKYVPQTTTIACEGADGNIVATTLNVGAVRLLNSEPDGNSDIQSTNISDAESKATTEVGLRELSEYVAEIKQQYEELTTDHNSLVDYNNWYRLNIDRK